MSWNRSLGVTAFVTVLAGLYLSLVHAPTDINLGEVQRIFYIHVAVAWNGFFAFFIVMLTSVLYLWTGRPVWDRLAYISGEIGVLFTTLVLVTGSIWGRAVWNTWWTWDPRLTTSLILWFMYLGYLLIRSAAEGEERKSQFAAVYGIIAFVMVPIVHMSVTWWRSIHPVVVTEGTFAIDPRMVPALVVIVLGFSLLFGYLVTVRVSMEEAQEEIALLRSRVMEGGAQG